MDYQQRLAWNRRYKRERFQANRAWIRSKFEGTPCMDCEGVFPFVCMDFDHRPGTAKLFEVGKGIKDKNRAALEAEVAKCDYVCSNCHRIRTFILREASRPARVE